MKISKIGSATLNCSINPSDKRENPMPSPYVSPIKSRPKPLRSLANQMSYTDKKLATEGKLT